MSKRGEIWVSATLYILIITIALVIVLAVVQPLVDRMRDKAAYTSNQNSALNLDQQIVGVASEGPGSQRIVPIEVKQGEFSIINDTINWLMESESKVIEPGATKEIGHVTVSSNNDVTAYETGNASIVKNRYIEVVFNKNYTNSDQVISEIILIETNSSVPGASFDFPDIEDEGYSELQQEGTKLGFATVILYNIAGGRQMSLTLHSEADFLEIIK